MATWKRISKQRKHRLHNAAVLLKQRQERVIHPEGEFAEKGKWYPSDTERQPCCEGLAAPTRKSPYSLNAHCRTAKHVAHLCDVPVDRLRQTAAKLPDLLQVAYLPVTLCVFRSSMASSVDDVFAASTGKRYAVDVPRTLTGHMRSVEPPECLGKRWQFSCGETLYDHLRDAVDCSDGSPTHILVCNVYLQADGVEIYPTKALDVTHLLMAGERFHVRYATGKRKRKRKLLCQREIP